MNDGEYTIKQIAAAVALNPRSVTLRLKSTAYSLVAGTTRPVRVYRIDDLPDDYRVKIAVCSSRSLSEKTVKEALESSAARKKQSGTESALSLSNLSAEQLEIANARDAFLTASCEYSKLAGFKFRKGATRTKKGEEAFLSACNSGEIEFDRKVIEGERSTVSWSTLNSWWKKREAGVAALAPRQKGVKIKGKTCLTKEQQGKLVALIYESPHAGPVNLRKGLQGELGTRSVPDYRVIQRFRDNWIKKNKEVFTKLCNPAEWKNKYMFALGDACGDVERLYQLVEGDSTPTDVMLNVDGKLVRYAIIGLIDLYSRRAQIVISPTSSAEGVVISLRKWIMNNGVMESLRIDNGKDWISHRVSAVLSSLEIDTKLCGKFKSEEKGTIERFFKTFLHGVAELSPHFIGHNIGQRQAIEERKTFAQRVMKTGGNPVEIAATPQEFQMFCDEWCDYVYGEDVHSTIDEKPNTMVRNWKYPITKITNVRALDMLLLPPAYKKGRRKIRKSGVQVDSGPYYPWYGAKEFAAHAGKWVYVLVDPTDMGRIICYLEKDDGSREYLCEAVNLAYEGIDRAAFASEVKKKHEKIVNGKLREIRADAKKEAVQDASKKYLELRKAEVVGSNVVSMPKRGVEHDTPQLAEARQAILSQDSAKLSRENPYEESAVEVVEQPKKSKVMRLVSDEDHYRNIRRSVEGCKRLLTMQEVGFLQDFYKTLSGKAAKKIDGNLIEDIGDVEKKAEKQA